jgi:uncharacterized membrane protein
MSRVEQTIDVDVPVRTAYDQWAQFETFPRFMEGIERVTQIDDTTLEWHANVGGQDKTWTAQIVEQTPDQRIAWRSTSGAQNAGIVSFTPNGPESTRVTLDLDADPEGPLESIGDALGVLERRVKGDLERFKEFIEGRGVPTGAWRGEVHGSQVDRS